MKIKREKIINNLLKGKLKGMTLIELTVSILLFSIIMTTVMAIFARSFTTYRNARAVQRDLESAQVAIGIMNKTLRSSNIVTGTSPAICEPATDPNCTKIRIFDYALNRCVQYQFITNQLKVASRIYIGGTLEGNKALCINETDATLGGFSDMVSGNIQGKFYVEGSEVAPPPGDNNVGRVTTSIRVCPPGGCGGSTALEARLQSTASLRNY